MNATLHNVSHWVVTNRLMVSVLTIAVGLALALLFLVWRAVHATVKKWRPEDVITVLIALAATVYAGSGNWKFLDRAMHYNADLKIILVSVFEGAVVVEGIRARHNITEYGAAGKDGRGLWVLAALSSLLSASESDTLQEAFGRLVVPLLAAFLWERLMESTLDIEAAKLAAARRKARLELNEVGQPGSRIRWRIRPERIAVWLRLADATDTTVQAIQINRRVVKYLKATDKEDRTGHWWLHWPLSAKARAERARIKLAADAMLHHGDPKAIYDALADLMGAQAMRRLGIAEKIDVISDSKPPNRQSRFPNDVRTTDPETPNRILDMGIAGTENDSDDPVDSNESTRDSSKSLLHRTVRIPASANPDSVLTTAVHARTSDPDPTDTGSELVGLLRPSGRSASITEVVRQVYRDNWDAATLQKVVAEILPDARPDSVIRTIRKIQRERTTQNPGIPSGGYL